jgi:hypothetical protein
MKPHAWTLWLVAGLLGTVGALVVSRGWAEETYDVQKKTGEVSNEGEQKYTIDHPGEEEPVSPESVTPVGETVTIVSKTMTPPGKMAFKKFLSPNPWQYVDIETDPEAPPGSADTDTASAIKIRVEDVPETAGDWPLKGEGNLNPGGGGGGVPKEWHWSAKISKYVVDLDTDTNNNGTIDDYEDEYEEYPSGRVVCLDREGDGEGLDDLGLIVLTPPDTDEGTVKLEAIEGGSLIKVWRDENKNDEVVLPATWSPAETPGQLYVDGIALGQVVLKLSHTPPAGDGMEDSVALYVTDTISWSPLSTPTDSFATFWEPCWGLSGGGNTAILAAVEDHGWNVLLYFKDTADDQTQCTLEHLRWMREGGIVAALSHGNGDLAVAYRDIEPDADAWWNKGPNEEPDMYTLESMGFPGHWAVMARAPWFENNWKPHLDERKAIVVIMGCYTALRVAPSCGGRVAFGYRAQSYTDDYVLNSMLLFGRLNGSADNFAKRTVGKAYGNGEDYVGGFEMVGEGDARKWTTINPAPNAVFPAGGVTHRGAGCIIFDTYMESTEPYTPNEAVRIVRGTVSDRWWFGNGSGQYLVSFTFPPHAFNSIALRAFGSSCVHASLPFDLRWMSGDRQTYGAHKEWSF